MSWHYNDYGKSKKHKRDLLPFYFWNDEKQRYEATWMLGCAFYFGGFLSLIYVFASVIHGGLL